MFEEIYEQRGEELTKGGFNLNVDKYRNMTSAEFAKVAREKHLAYYGDRIPTIAEAEDLHWSELCKSSKLYAMNNSMSLFGDDCQVWNLDRFTSYESLIHYDETHHKQQVCIFRYIYVFNVFYVQFNQLILFLQNSMSWMAFKSHMYMKPLLSHRLRSTKKISI